ncbi:MAG: hypothetical protein Q9162_007465 [Coniocarpon cinnabarinum]
MGQATPQEEQRAREIAHQHPNVVNSVMAHLMRRNDTHATERIVELQEQGGHPGLFEKSSDGSLKPRTKTASFIAGQPLRQGSSSSGPNESMNKTQSSPNLRHISSKLTIGKGTREKKSGDAPSPGKHDKMKRTQSGPMPTATTEPTQNPTVDPARKVPQTSEGKDLIIPGKAQQTFSTKQTPLYPYEQGSSKEYFHDAQQPDIENQYQPPNQPPTQPRWYQEMVNMTSRPRKGDLREKFDRFNLKELTPVVKKQTPKKQTEHQESDDKPTDLIPTPRSSFESNSKRSGFSTVPESPLKEEAELRAAQEEEKIPVVPPAITEEKDREDKDTPSDIKGGSSSSGHTGRRDSFQSLKQDSGHLKRSFEQKDRSDPEQLRKRDEELHKFPFGRPPKDEQQGARDSQEHKRRQFQDRRERDQRNKKPDDHPGKEHYGGNHWKKDDHDDQPPLHRRGSV